jgi:hypothetical protein
MLSRSIPPCSISASANTEGPPVASAAASFFSGRVSRAVLVSMLGLTIATTNLGCFGKFNLVRVVYGVNEKIQDKFVRSLVCWVLLIIPVYEVSGFLDFILFNVIEFWGGSNPISAGNDPQTRVAERDGRRIVMSLVQREGGRVMHVKVFRGDKLETELDLADDGQGKVRAKLEQANVAASSTELRELRAEILESMDVRVTTVTDAGESTQVVQRNEIERVSASPGEGWSRSTRVARAAITGTF